VSEATREVRTRRPAVEGWMRVDEADPRLLGSRCRACGSFFFPKETSFCRNPECASSEFEEVPLSRRGRLWSFTNNCYPPPPPYVAPEPFEPYAIAAVELEREKMVVLGQVVPGVRVEQLKVGMEMELVIAPLFADDEHVHLVWKWRPVAA
jgi:uncharacterized OB-fold protein